MRCSQKLEVGVLIIRRVILLWLYLSRVPQHATFPQHIKKLPCGAARRKTFFFALGALNLFHVFDLF